MGVARLAAAIAALAIAGCGGDDETTDATGASGASGAAGAPLTEEEFVSQGNAICADVNSGIVALQAPTGDDLDGLATFASQGLEITEPALASFQALTPPGDLQATFDEYVTQAADQIEQTKELQAAAEAGDEQQVQSLLDELNSVDNDQSARALGLDECAQDVDPQG